MFDSAVYHVGEAIEKEAWKMHASIVVSKRNMKAATT